MTNNEPLIMNLKEIREDDLLLVGGKGANLGEMASAGFPVPPGFCLTTAAFRRFIASVSQSEQIYERLNSAKNLDEVRKAGSYVRGILLNTPVPDIVLHEAERAWKNLGTQESYAVRSSATAEDLPGVSFAGQQDTYLNIIGRDNLMNGIRRCWISLFNDRAIIYRMQNSFSHANVALSVIVQQMVMAEKSGVMFTADPLTGHRHTLVIDASFGLGEALVSGAVTPDSYRVDKRIHTIIDSRISRKQLAVFPEKGGGVCQEELPLEQQNKTVLSNREIEVLTEMGCQVESHYGSPQDIEWAVSGGKIHLLQSRPITSLYPIDGLISPDGSLHVYFSLGHQQNMTRAMPPLSLSLFPLILPVRLDTDGTSPYLRFSGGRIYIDETQALRHPLFRRVLFGILSQFDILVPKAFKLVMDRPEFKGPHGIHLTFKSITFVFGILHRVFNAMWLRNLEGFISRTNEKIDTYIAENTSKLEKYSPGKKQVQAAFDALRGAFPFFLNWVPEAGAGNIAARLLNRTAKKYLPSEKANAITLGIKGNVVAEMNLALGDLADLAKQSPGLSAWFTRLDNAPFSWLEKAEKIEDSAPFFSAWRKFLDRYGSRGPSEIDIMMPRWNENPLPVLTVIKENILKNMSSRSLFNAQTAMREKVYKELLEKTGHGLFGKFRVWKIKRLYHVCTETGGMREHHKFVMIRLFWVVKQILEKNAQKLVQDGKLVSNDDIWFLTSFELLEIWNDTSTNWEEIISKRRKELNDFQKLTPPVILTSDGETPIVRHQVDDAPPGSLLGNPVSPGIAEGIAHVVLDPLTETLAPGEILVAPFTDPGWTPLFINAAGLVMNIGGELAHGSVIAREYAIPAVVGVYQATAKIKTGQRIRVDGNRGIIEILKE